MQLRTWLHQSRDRLAADLHPDDVLDRLIGPGLLSPAEALEIDRLASREAKVRRLIRLIDWRDSDRLLATFRDSLLADYRWLAEPPDCRVTDAASVTVADGGGDVGCGSPLIPPLVGDAACRIGRVAADDALKAASLEFRADSISQVSIPPLVAVSPQSEPSGIGAASQQPAISRAHLELVCSNALALENWRAITRDLGVAEDDIECAQARQPLDLRGQCCDALRLWSTQYEGASLPALLRALRKQKLNRLAARLASL
ncbi:hypothetical protein BOX15_Mlig025703g1 [Macrostomum lignano]|uniref:Death domain-containing protein n=2 Tax=Macrostomum lignano TaxID=282301 RepID=A0A267H1I5_9PLAT|nr:hypothetical protein BOX15_Mlig014788g1 [Macrostomum lignano]PAA92125.1 hypothetical protein BOX15_Mlig025703g1 [Macrostomum lignano]